MPITITDLLQPADERAATLQEAMTVLKALFPEEYAMLGTYQLSQRRQEAVLRTLRAVWEQMGLAPGGPDAP